MKIKFKTSLTFPKLVLILYGRTNNRLEQMSLIVRHLQQHLAFKSVILEGASNNWWRSIELVYFQE